MDGKHGIAKKLKGGCTPLEVAVLRGENDIVKELLSIDYCGCSACMGDDKTPRLLLPNKTPAWSLLLPCLKKIGDQKARPPNFERALRPTETSPSTSHNHKIDVYGFRLLTYSVHTQHHTHRGVARGDTALADTEVVVDRKTNKVVL
jgi:hypothetical protein